MPSIKHFFSTGHTGINLKRRVTTELQDSMYPNASTRFFSPGFTGWSVDYEKK